MSIPRISDKIAYTNPGARGCYINIVSTDIIDSSGMPAEDCEIASNLHASIIMPPSLGRYAKENFTEVVIVYNDEVRAGMVVIQPASERRNAGQRKFRIISVEDPDGHRVEQRLICEEIIRTVCG